MKNAVVQIVLLSINKNAVVEQIVCTIVAIQKSVDVNK